MVIILPIERQNFIKKLLLKNKSMKISELSSSLSVSEMTIHRDLKPLVDEGFVIKTFGGVTLSEQIDQLTGNSCIYCNQCVHDKLSFRLVLDHNDIEIACCGHCGLLRFHQIEVKVRQVMCQDFLRLTTLNAKKAYFVLETTLQLGCCQPQLLPFEHLEDAEKFVKGFKGRISSFDEALKFVLDEMNSSKI